MGLIDNDFKNKYNDILANYRKGEKWTNEKSKSWTNSAKDEEQIEKACKRLSELADILDSMLTEYYNITGAKMSDELVLKGFK